MGSTSFLGDEKKRAATREVFKFTDEQWRRLIALYERARRSEITLAVDLTDSHDGTSRDAVWRRIHETLVSDVRVGGVLLLVTERQREWWPSAWTADKTDRIHVETATREVRSGCVVLRAAHDGADRCEARVRTRTPGYARACGDVTVSRGERLGRVDATPLKSQEPADGDAWPTSLLAARGKPMPDDAAGYKSIRLPDGAEADLDLAVIILALGDALARQGAGEPQRVGGHGSVLLVIATGHVARVNVRARPGCTSTTVTAAIGLSFVTQAYDSTRADGTPGTRRVRFSGNGHVADVEFEANPLIA